MNLKEVISICSRKTKLVPAAIEALFNYQAHQDLAKYLKITVADLDSILNGEANFSFAKQFDLNQAEIDNLLDKFGKPIIIGMIIGKMLK